MNTLNNHCSRCGANLPTEVSDGSCQKCLLEIGLESGTDFSFENLAETLPHREEPGTNARTDLVDGPVGLQRYRDLQSIHDWSGGAVYRAYHEGLQRFVLLRVLESSADDDSRREFLRRAEKLSHLNHAHTVSTLEAGVDNGAAYVAEEWLEGLPVGGFLPRSRRERWAEGFFPNGELMRVMRDAASGLHAIHQAGMTHDRINPDSILIDTSGIVKLIGLGEASDSSDDRFAMPGGGTRQELRKTEQPKVLATSATAESVAADLFRFGATFCYLTTGKLPGVLDPTLRYSTLFDRIKKSNPGLRSGVCRVLAKCLDQRELIPASPESTLPDQNPYSAQAVTSEHPYPDAAEVANELQRLLLVSTSRAAWRPRIYSVVLEGLLLVLSAGAAQLWSQRQNGNGFGNGPLWLSTLPITLPITYTILFETIYGWTPVRRGFGLRLFDFAGEPSRWWRRMFRAMAKILLFISLAIVPALVGPLFPLLGVQLPLPFVMVCFATWLVGFPALVYVTALFWPSRWTVYDLVAGVTWGEQTRETAKPVSDSTHLTTSRSRLATPTGKVDQYELYEPLGSGGMGHVFRGRDTVLGRDVAIKLLSGSLIENPLLLERFQREARLAAKVNHPGVAKVFGNGVWNRTPYIAMELVPGSNLQQRIKQRGQIPISTAWNYIIQAAEALRAAEQSGVVHRDVKPANLMVTDDGRLKVTDFGVSRSVKLEPDCELQEMTELGVTGVGSIVGTPAYMAPEQAMGKEVDCRSDIYALGMTLYHMLSGHAPFKANSAVEMLAQQMSEKPASLLGQVSELTHDQAVVLERMIAKSPADRYDNYDELLGALKLHAPGVDLLASPLKRVAAEACNLVAMYLLFSIGLMASFVGVLQLGSPSDLGKWIVAGMFLLLLSAFVGTYVIGVGRHGRTPGKRQLGLRVVSVKDARVGYQRAAIRFAVAYPLLVVFILRFVYHASIDGQAHPMENVAMYTLCAIQVLVAIVSTVMMWIRPDRKTLHDLAAGTTVIRDKR